MVSVTFNELELNAVNAALDDLLIARARDLRRLRHIRADLKEQRDSPENARHLRDNDLAIECAEAAIRHATLAQLTLAAALPDPEYPTTARVTWIGIEQYQAESR